MNTLILGSGGREHAIAWKIAQSEKSSQLFIAPGNPGTAELGKNINLSLSDFEGLGNFILEQQIELLVVGPEAPLVEGIVDFFRADARFDKLGIIGPNRAGAMLEGSKDFAKEFMQEFEVPTAAYETFGPNNLDEAFRFLEGLKPPYVLKADGLAGGKGVVILSDLSEAKAELSDMLLQEKFGAASRQVVIEEYLDGIEMSVFVLTDGKEYLILPEAKDYKRIGEGDTGLNTGGMGAVSPVPFADEALLKKIKERIVEPSVRGIEKRGFDYKGFLFIGLMIVNQEPFVIEYNVRMGDPETEVVLPRIDSDLLQHLMACTSGKLGKEEIRFVDESACTVMLVSGGYPSAYEKGKVMKGWENARDSVLFHAGTQSDGNQLKTAGGRVMAITSLSMDRNKALEKSFQMAETISFEGKYYRTDIGKDLN